MIETPYTINGINHCELYVGNAKQAAYFYENKMGFKIIAYSGLETGNRNKVSYLLNQNKINLVLTSPLKDGTEIGLHIQKHGDGIKDIAFIVDDANSAFNHSIKKGAIGVNKPKLIKDKNGSVVIASIKTFGDTIHSFIENNNYNGVFLPGFKVYETSPKKDSADLLNIDHIVGNQPEGEMKKVCKFYEDIFGWHRFWTVDDKDISTKYSALRSIVMANNNEKIKMPINEPALGEKKSQIQEFIDYYGSAGVQHIAMSTNNIISTVKILRARSVKFLETPKSYYKKIKNRVGEIDEDINILEKLGILVDSDDDGYMLQIFTKPLQDRPTLFFEIIQRKGSKSFGKGNFKALFESIESEQKKRGNL
tara:strand:+ start:5173 stop:6267 length:1095 start_codon:yes stop_codon:yes gene_type:complete